MQGRKRCLRTCKGEKDVFVHASDKNMGTLKGKVKWFNGFEGVVEQYPEKRR